MADEPAGSTFRELVETVPVVFYVADATGRVIYLSPGFEVISGYPPSRIYDGPRGWMNVVLPDDRERIAEVIAKNRGKAQYELEYRIVRADGAVRWLLSRSSEIRGPDGALERIVGVATDVTQRRELEEQLRQAQKMDAVGKLAGGVAHDFNNLLTVIIANAGLLRARTEASDGAVRREVAEIEAAAQQAADLTKKLLGFSRQAMLNLVPVELGAIAADVATLLRHTLDARVDLLVRASADLETVVGDRAELTHVVLNLCLNARDAMPRGGRLTLETGRSLIDAAHAERVSRATVGTFAYVSVADTGTGIPAEILGHIYEPFFTTKPPGKGTGLGLAVARGIVEQHCGFIECSTSPVGTRFTIFLPFGEQTRGGRDVGARPSSLPRGARAGVGERILFVDDEEAIRMIAGRILGMRGYEVELAADGDEAVAAFERAGGEIDLAIVDLTMPRMTGLELVEALRASRKGLRVIISTGHIGDEPRALDKLAAASVLPKPYTIDQLLLAVRRALDA